MEIAIRAGPSLDGYWVLLLNDHYAVAMILRFVQFCCSTAHGAISKSLRSGVKRDDPTIIKLPESSLLNVAPG